MGEIMLKIDNVSKLYKLGEIGGTTLRDELQRLRAKRRGEEDPTKRIGAKGYNKGETFMALDGVSFNVKKGERVGIIGHNGAGKSTLLKLISRVTAPTTGAIGMNGRVASMLEVGTGFHPELTGRENIYMNGAILGMTKKEIDAKMESIIEFSECRQFIDTPVKRYSSGMYVKLAFSVSAHLDSEIMIMDEVLAVGDAAFQNKCLEKMRRVSTEEGRTILYVSHNMDTIRRLCDRCVVLSHGKIVHDGGVEEGIQLYTSSIDNYYSDLPNYYNCAILEREAEQYGHYARISGFEFVGKDKPNYFEGEQIAFRIQWHAKCDIYGIRVRAAVKKMDGTNVGMAESTDYTDAHENVSYDQCYLMDIDNLTDGLYFMKVFLYVRNAANMIMDVDAATARIFFRVVSNPEKKTVWLGNYWGPVRLNDMTLIRE